MATDAVCFTENSIGRRAGRRHDGCADCRAPRQRRIPGLLLDVSAQPRARASSARESSSPTRFSRLTSIDRIQTGGFDADLERVAQADWIIEAIIEQADAKRALLERVDAVRRPGSIVSSNTSGLSIAGLSQGRSADFRRHWLGTHFFNPPRYLSLLELIPTAETDPAVIAAIRDFADRRLGKNVVIAKDTPGFIANHVAMHGLVRIFEALAAGNYTVEEIDAMTGAAIGRPKSATFRTVDIAGLDILVHVANDLAHRAAAATRVAISIPAVRARDAHARVDRREGRPRLLRAPKERPPARPTSGRSIRSTMEYRPQAGGEAAVARSGRVPSAARADAEALFRNRSRRDVLSSRRLPPSLRYTAEVASEIAYSIDDIDRAMRWGYGWPLGPFELADAIGFG